MSNVLMFMGIAACGITLGVLVTGIRGFGTSKMTPQKQNKLMRWRIIAQFVAVILLLLAVLAAKGN